DGAGGEGVTGLGAWWDVAQEIAGTRMLDVGPRQCHGSLHNMPTRAVTGATWSGREMCWRHAPDEYAAIHFHEDDIVDCGWPATHEWTVPGDLRSGSYALLLEAGAAQEKISFFVVPPLRQPPAKNPVFMSTLPYIIFPNQTPP